MPIAAFLTCLNVGVMVLAAYASHRWLHTDFLTTLVFILAFDVGMQRYSRGDRP